ncbi:Peptidase [Tenacibaculum sp. 190524A05c]|uniref:S41 family peptidase n=1 Tax=Tenacibaculum platacis TaxID=3137852 RepID=UPI0031FAC99D
MRKRILLLLISTFTLACFSQSKYERDFHVFWEMMDKEYAYFDKKETDWQKVKELYEPRAKKITKDWEFTYLIELIKYELYDSHVGLNRNVPFSFRLIPNDTDAWIVYKNGKYIISDLRSGYRIIDSGIKIGSELIGINDKKIEDLVQKNLPATVKSINDEIRSYIANLLFAGRHNEPRKVTVSYKGNKSTFELEKATRIEQNSGLLYSEIIDGNIGYIKINNTLMENGLITEFIQKVDEFSDTKSIIIDLRDTHSGGNTTVAKAIMGKFITETMPYQIHELVYDERQYGIKRKYIELLSPLSKPYTNPVYVLVGRWTGSVGEAIAQGFSSISSAKVVGTEMAKLLGAIRCEVLPETKLSICFPFEKLYSSKGIPREDFIPEIKTNTSIETYKKVRELLNE